MAVGPMARIRRLVGVDQKVLAQHRQVWQGTRPALRRPPCPGRTAVGQHRQAGRRHARHSFAQCRRDEVSRSTPFGRAGFFTSAITAAWPASRSGGWRQEVAREHAAFGVGAHGRPSECAFGRRHFLALDGDDFVQNVGHRALQAALGIACKLPPGPAPWRRHRLDGSTGAFQCPPSPWPHVGGVSATPALNATIFYRASWLSSTPTSMALRDFRRFHLSQGGWLTMARTEVFGWISYSLISPSSTRPPAWRAQASPRPCRRGHRPPRRARHPGVAARAPGCPPGPGGTRPSGCWAPGRVGQRAQDVEDGAHAQFRAHRRHVFMAGWWLGRT